MNPVYLDYNATTPLTELVKDGILNDLYLWANPSSSYVLGKETHAKIENARSQIAEMIDCRPTDIIFTSCGTESNNSIIYSVVENYKKNEDALLPHIITSSIEHDSINILLKKLESNNILEVTFVKCDHDGRVKPKDVISSIKMNTQLITIMLANNETGIIQPIQEISDAIHKYINNDKCKSFPCRNLIFHTDAAQAIGKIPVSVKDLGIHAMTIVGHKFYGPRIGVLYYKSENPFIPLFYGGGQEKGLRSGTENTLMILALGVASKIVEQNLENFRRHMVKMTIYLITNLINTFGNQIHFNNIECIKKSCKNHIHNGDFNGENDQDLNLDIVKLFQQFQTKALLPNTLNIAFRCERLPGWLILKHCPLLCASTGAACHSLPGGEIHDDYTGSEVLLNSGVVKLYAKNAIRLSVGRETTTSDIDFAIKQIKDAVSIIKSYHYCQNKSIKAMINLLPGNL